MSAKKQEPGFRLEMVNNPLAWSFAEYAPGKRVLAEHFPDRSVITGRWDVQINPHGVVLFYNQATAYALLERAVIPVEANTGTPRASRPKAR
jgi:hypothetical protein